MNGSFRRSHHSSNQMQKQMHYSPNLLNCINNAIENSLVTAIEYDSREKGISVREIEPMAIVYREGKRNLVGWCRLRNDFRSFRLDRLNLVKLLKERFDPRADFRVEDFQDGSSQNGEEFEDED
ncbi:MAG: WYL domain-containing protein [Chitinophagales bacterium]